MRKPSRLLDLLATVDPPELGPGPRAGVQPQTTLNAELDHWLAARSLPTERQQLIRALVLLWHDHLDAAHRLAQDVPGPDGAFVHGIMHRREPDASNAAYWFRRVGAHSSFPELADKTALLLEQYRDQELLNHLLPGGQWDPFAFIDACAVAGSFGANHEPQLRQIQRLETETLLGWLAQGIQRGA